MYVNERANSNHISQRLSLCINTAAVIYCLIGRCGVLFSEVVIKQELLHQANLRDHEKKKDPAANDKTTKGVHTWQGWRWQIG